MSDDCVEEGKKSVPIEEASDKRKSPGTRKAWLLARWIEGLLGLTFIVAGVLKAVDISAFAVQVSYYGIIREPALVRLAALSAVLLETAIGIALLVGWRLRGWTLRSVFAMLAGFTVLILYAWVFEGLADCGCFGSFIKMGPGVSILKNLVMMALVAVAWIGYRKAKIESAERIAKPRRVAFTRVASAAACCLVTLAALAYGYSRQAEVDPPRPPTIQPYDKERPFAQFQFEIEGFDWDLGSGEYFVALLSDSCDHCAEDMEELNELPMLLPDMPPIIALVFGEEETLQQLREQVQPQYPTILIDPLTFMQLLDDAPPRFFYVRDGKELHHWDEELPEDVELIEILAELSETVR